MFKISKLLLYCVILKMLELQVSSIVLRTLSVFFLEKPGLYFIQSYDSLHPTYYKDAFERNKNYTQVLARQYWSKLVEADRPPDKGPSEIFIGTKSSTSKTPIIRFTSEIFIGTKSSTSETPIIRFTSEIFIVAIERSWRIRWSEAIACSRATIHPV
jgi:hypothetical protein